MQAPQAPNLSEVINTVNDHLTQRLPGRKEFNETVLCRLRAGHVPCSPSELSAINAFIHDTSHDMASCDEAIVQLENALRPLRARRNDLQQAHDNAKALLSPVRRLSADVVEQIFTACIHNEGPWTIERESGYALRVSTRHISCTTMELAQVSSFWRQVALSRPMLWSSICIDTEQFAEHAGLLDTLEAYILRSKNVPLRLRVDTEGFCSEQLWAYDLLLAESRRWRSVILNLEGPWINYHANRVGLDSASDRTSPLPLLEYLCMSDTRLDHDSDWSLFSSCPALKTFEGRTMNYSDFTSFDFSKLKQLDAVGFGGQSSVGRFFAHMPLLESCCLNDFRSLEVSDNLHNKLVDVSGYYCTNLTSLDFTTDCLQSKIWWTLRLPRLTKLIIRLRYENGSLTRYDLMDFSSVLVQSGCALQEVALPGLPAELVVDFLTSHQSITTLKLTLPGSNVMGGSYNSLFTGLMELAGEPPSASIIVPNLRSFAIHITRPKKRLSSAPTLEGWGEAVCSMVELRCARVGSKLERFALSVWAQDGHSRRVERLIRDRLSPLGILAM